MMTVPPQSTRKPERSAARMSREFEMGIIDSGSGSVSAMGIQSMRTSGPITRSALARIWSSLKYQRSASIES